MARYIFIFLGLFIHFFSLAQRQSQTSGLLILDYDVSTQRYGIALMSNGLDTEGFKWYFFEDQGFIVFVGPGAKVNETLYLESFTTTEPLLEALNRIKSLNQNSHYDQVGVFPNEGEATFINGKGLKSRPGHSQVIQKGRFMVFGYQLSSEDALKNIMQTLESNANLSIGDRLIKALETGKAENVLLGEIQSTLLREIKFSDPSSEIYIKNHEPNALESLISQYRLRRSVINLNQALEAFQAKKTTNAKNQLEAFTGQFPQIEGIHMPLFKAYILLGQEEKAAQILQKAVEREPSYQAFLPDFHYLKKYEAYAKLVDDQQFNAQEWNRAIQSYLELNKVDEAIYWINQTLKKYPNEAYTYYLMGEAYHLKRNKRLARKSYQKALKVDPDLLEAKIALQKFTKK